MGRILLRSHLSRPSEKSDGKPPHAIEGSGYITVGSTKADVLSFDFAAASIGIGHYDAAGKWIKTSDVVPPADGRLSLFPCKVYRITLK